MYHDQHSIDGTRAITPVDTAGSSGSGSELFLEALFSRDSVSHVLDCEDHLMNLRIISLQEWQACFSN